MSDKVRKAPSSASKRALAYRAPYAKKNAKKIAEVAPAPVKEPRFYGADDAPHALPRRGKTVQPAKLRDSIRPGTVLILLSGRFKGKRVIFLKQLASGLLLVTGPYKVNGVPLRRVNQAYVIATSTVVDISKVSLDNVNDDFFKRAPKEKSKKEAGEFFKEEKKSNAISDARKAEQKKVDSALLSKIGAVDQLGKYLGAKFTLTQNLLPHDIKF